MAIKTDELQQNAAPQGTDTLLMANSAGGTTQLTLANLAKFLTEQDNAVKTALSNKAVLSAQQTVELTGVTSRTVELAAANLPDYIAGLPRLLTEDLTVKVSGTLTADTLWFSHFYGPGSLTVRAEADGDAVLKARVRISACASMVTFRDIRFQDPAPGAEDARDGLEAEFGSVVRAYGCSFSSTDGGVLHNHGYRALSIGEGAVLCTYGIKNISGCACAALAAQGGIIIISAATADALHDNATGAYVWNGGIVILCGNTPDAMGGASNVKSGGMIVGPNGTML